MTFHEIHTRRSSMTRTLYGIVLACGVLTIGHADDKPSRNKVRESASVERAARVERNSATPAVRGNGQGTGAARTLPSPESSNATVPNANKQRFQPSFNREPQRQPITPTVNNAPRPTLSNQEGSSASAQVLLMASRNDKNKNKEKPPQPEKPQPEKRSDDKPHAEKPREDKPHVEKPHVEKPQQVKQPEVELPKPNKVHEQPKVDLPPVQKERPNRDKGQNESGSQIRIQGQPNVKVTPTLPVNPGDAPRPKIRINGKSSADVTERGKVDPAMGKIKLKTPSDAKPNISLDNDPRKNDSHRDDSQKTRDRHVEKGSVMKPGTTLNAEQRERIRKDIEKDHQEHAANQKQGNGAGQLKVKLPSQAKMTGTERLQKMPRDVLKVAVPKNGKIDPAVAAKLKMQPARDVLKTRLKNGDLHHLANGKSGQKFQLQKQFQLHQHGDIGRRMNLVAGLHQRGGWRHRFFGHISPIYSRHCRSMWYAGPSFCAPYVWYPSWSTWVDWCWWDTCAPLYDPRPVFCQPIVYDPCTPWVAWNFPTWQPLPYVTCGTWVDVDPVVVDAGIDLQLLATRFVDPGHVDQELGPRFRVWIRNNSSFDLNQEFNVLLIASTDANAYAGLPEAGVRVLGLRAGETQAIDIRLPFAANTLGRDSSGNAIPITYLTALVDSHNELPESMKANNGATLIRGDILPVDPAAFAAEPSSAQPNGIMHIAGEGLGPEPGQAMVVIGDQEFQAEILGWFDLGVQIRLPDFDLDAPTAADLVIIRGDGAASNPLTIEIDPAAVVPEAVAEPGPQLPEAPPLPEPAP